jgi:toxin ParE1/3/4
MLRLVIVRPGAEADLAEARAWYEQQRAGLGSEFLGEVARAMQALGEHPERHPLYYRGFRRILLRRFPYKLFYRLEAERVVVFRVLHVKRDHPKLL